MSTKNLLVELLVEELPPKALKKLGESLRIRMSSRKRWRNGLMVGVVGFMILLLSKNEADCLTSQHGEQKLPVNCLPA